MFNLNLNKVIFNPTHLANLQVWLAADKISQNDNSVVSVWPDYSGNGNHFINVNPPTLAQPVLMKSYINGYPTVGFNYLTAQGSSSACFSSLKNVVFQPITLCCVVQFGTNANAYNILSSFAGGINIYMSSASQIALACQSQFSIGNSSTTSWIPTQPSRPFVITMTYDQASNFAFFVNGVFFGSGNNGSLSNSSGILKIGCSGTGFSLNGNIPEMLVFSQALPRVVTQQIESYLNRKYAIF